MRKLYIIIMILLFARPAVANDVTLKWATWPDVADSAKLFLYTAEGVLVDSTGGSGGGPGEARLMVRRYDSTLSLNIEDTSYLVVVEIWFPGDTVVPFYEFYDRLPIFLSDSAEYMNVKTWVGSAVAGVINVGSQNVIPIDVRGWRGQRPKDLTSDSAVRVDIKGISLDTIAANNFEADYDGAGYAKGAASRINAVRFVMDENSLNLVRNPGFERDSAVSNVAPEFWVKGDGTHTADESQTSVAGGQWQFYMQPANSETSFLYQYVGDMPAGHYWLSGTMDFENDVDGGDQFIVLDNVIPTSTSNHIDSVQADSTSTNEYGKAVTVPAGDVYIGLRINRPGAFGSGFFDNIKLTFLSYDTSDYSGEGPSDTGNIKTMLAGNRDLVTGYVAEWYGTINDPAPTITAFVAASAGTLSPFSTNKSDNFYNNSMIVFTSGILKGKGQPIVGWKNAQDSLIYAGGFPIEPLDGDSFMLVHDFFADIYSISGDVNAADTFRAWLDGYADLQLTNREHLFNNLDEVLSARSPIGDTAIGGDERDVVLVILRDSLNAAHDSLVVYETRWDSLLAAASDEAKGHVGDSAADITWNHDNRYVKNAGHGVLVLNSSFEGDSVLGANAPTGWNLGAGTHTNNTIIAAIGDGRWSYKMNLESPTDSSIVWQQLGEVELGAYSVSAIIGGGGATARKQLFIADATPSGGSPTIIDSVQHSFAGVRQLQFNFIKTSSHSDPIFLGIRADGASGAAIFDNIQFIPIGWDSTANQGAGASLTAGAVAFSVDSAFDIEHGAGAYDGGTGGGSDSVQIFATDTLGTDVNIGFIVHELFDAGGTFINKQTANSGGATLWMLSGGTYKLHTPSRVTNGVFFPGTEYSFTHTGGVSPDSIGEVTAGLIDPDDSILMGYNIPITPNTSDITCVVYGFADSGNGFPVENAYVEMWLPDDLFTTGGTLIAGKTIGAYTDNTGKFEIEVLRSSSFDPAKKWFLKWTYNGNVSKDMSFFVPDSASFKVKTR